MSRPFHVTRCQACAHAIFPPRPICPRCGRRTWRWEVARHGTVEHATSRVDAETGGPVRLAEVRLDAGPLVTARCQPGVGAGDRVCLALVGATGMTSRLLASPEGVADASACSTTETIPTRSRTS
jgi:hypothetical protein